MPKSPCKWIKTGRNGPPDLCLVCHQPVRGPREIYFRPAAAAVRSNRTMPANSSGGIHAATGDVSVDQFDRLLSWMICYVFRRRKRK